MPAQNEQLQHELLLTVAIKPLSGWGGTQPGTQMPASDDLSRSAPAATLGHLEAPSAEGYPDRATEENLVLGANRHPHRSGAGAERNSEDHLYAHGFCE